MRSLLTSIQSHWQQHFSLAVPTYYPGVPTPIQDSPAWVELWVDALDQPPQRSSTPSVSSILVTVHCFSRHPDDATFAHQLAEAAITTLARQQIPLINPDESSAPPQAHLSLHEPSLRNLTRADQPPQPQLQHLVLSFTGTLHQLS